MSRRTSPVWNLFSNADNKNNLVKCNICKDTISYKSSVTYLKRHILKKHPTVNILLGRKN